MKLRSYEGEDREAVNDARIYLIELLVASRDRHPRQPFASRSHPGPKAPPNQPCVRSNLRQFGLAREMLEEIPGFILERTAKHRRRESCRTGAHGIVQSALMPVESSNLKGAYKLDKLRHTAHSRNIDATGLCGHIPNSTKIRVNPYILGC
jgi:hypothetical protein